MGDVCNRSYDSLRANLIGEPCPKCGHAVPAHADHCGICELEQLQGLEAIVRKLAGSDPWIAGESSKWCHHCKAQKAFAVEYESVDALHDSDCLWLLAKQAVGDE